MANIANIEEAIENMERALVGFREYLIEWPENDMIKENDTSKVPIESEETAEVIETTDIKCGNISMGINLLEDIKDRLNSRYLGGSIVEIEDIEVRDHTWIRLSLKFSNRYSHGIRQRNIGYVRGLVTGILIWSGVDVI